jgi:DNA-binding MarR family transcriptional regulator
MVENTTTDAGHARRELRERLRDLLKAVRVLKGHLPPHRTAIPTGMAGLLATIDAMATPGCGERAGPADRHGCHVKDLAAHNALDPSTVSRAVAALVRLGLVRRTADPTDGRASFLALTDRGQAALTETHESYDHLLTGALRDWSPRELAAFAAMLHRFSDDVLTYLDDPHLEHPAPATAVTPHNTLEAAR